MAEWFGYILASHKRGALYIGVTNDIARRLVEHRSGAIESFTRRHAVHRLVHLETADDPEAAIRREKRLKRWRRDWKIALIEQHNPDWRDLADELQA
jgi:putative endonuclease